MKSILPIYKQRCYVPVETLCGIKVILLQFKRVYAFSDINFIKYNNK